MSCSGSRASILHQSSQLGQGSSEKSLTIINWNALCESYQLQYTAEPKQIPNTHHGRSKSECTLSLCFDQRSRSLYVGWLYGVNCICSYCSIVHDPTCRYWTMPKRPVSFRAVWYTCWICAHRGWCAKSELTEPCKQQNTLGVTRVSGKARLFFCSSLSALSAKDWNVFTWFSYGDQIQVCHSRRSPSDSLL